ncbi:hypothetical protein [Streptomyces halobius]|uniref:Recombinase domain-containing protein n=1 Tax=Streptomyces halobius TaxID=2879846 RepID=A0ABY4M443_9ACTN|nr:hypothetical protein [Streptomyces halobius]UQA92524.1 hypothetical protein K9S39_12415 [Streptomyces halobius]
MSAWRDIQKEEKAAWQAKHRKNPQKYGPYVDSGYVFTMPDGRPWHPDTVSQAFSRLITRLGLPPHPPARPATLRSVPQASPPASP